MEKMRVIIAGGRNFNNYQMVNDEVGRIIYYVENVRNDDIAIVEGEANGADTLGKQFAINNKIKLYKFPADWEKNGKYAGFMRNNQMAVFAKQSSDAILIAFWNGKSRGTQNMIQNATELGIRTYIIPY